MIDPTLRSNNYLEQVSRQSNAAGGAQKTAAEGTGKTTDADNTRPNEHPTGSATSSLTQQDFMRLLTQQLAYQDPFKPVSNDQMVSQMASFSTVDGINKMGEQFAAMNQLMGSGQALQASSLVGQDVLLPTSDVCLENGQVSGAIFAKNGEKLNNLSIRVENESGQLIKTIDMGGEKDGVIRFNWDGTDKDGNPVAEGKYKLKATAEIEGENKDITDQLATYHRVSSVVLQSDAGALINVKGVEGGIPLGNILEVGKVNGSNGGSPTPKPEKPVPPIGELPEEDTDEQRLRRFL
ncbi:MAG: flagellar hook assembly protein FlgD [Plesiomonas shigelloides]